METNIDKILKKISKGNKKRIKQFLKLFQNSVRESNELKQIFKKSLSGNKISEEESEIVKHHTIDILKSLGLTSMFILPFGSIIVILIIKLSEQYKIQILPESFRDELGE